MTDPASDSTIERTEALWKLCKGEVTLISLAKHDVLLTLVSKSGDGSGPEILLRAFKEVARMGRISVLQPAGATYVFGSPVTGVSVSTLECWVEAGLRHAGRVRDLWLLMVFAVPRDSGGGRCPGCGGR